MRNKDKIYLRDVKLGLYVFEGKVCTDGYSLTDEAIHGFDLTSNPGAKEIPIIVPKGTRYMRYGTGKTQMADLIDNDLLLSEGALHRRFMALKDNDNNGILKFVNKYGLLMRTQMDYYILKNKSTGKIRQQGESVQFWRQMISKVAALVELWDMIRGEDNRITNIVKWSEKGISIYTQGNWKDILSPSLGNMRLLSRWQKGDVKGPILYYICIETGNFLTNTISPRVLPFAKLEISQFIDTLRAAIGVMFLMEISGRTKIIQCPICGGWIDAYRRTKKFCSDACKQKKYRERKNVNEAQGKEGGTL